MGLGSARNGDLEWAPAIACMAACFSCPDWFRSLDRCRDLRLEGRELVTLVNDLLGILCLVIDCQRIWVLGFFCLEVRHLFDRNLLAAKEKFA